MGHRAATRRSAARRCRRSLERAACGCYGQLPVVVSAALLHDVCELVRDEAPSLARRRTVRAVAEHDMAAHRVRPGGDGCGRLGCLSARVHTHTREVVAERGFHLLAH